MEAAVATVKKSSGAITPLCILWNSLCARCLNFGLVTNYKPKKYKKSGWICLKSIVAIRIPKSQLE